MLHTLHRSPWLTDFAALLRLLSEGDETAIIARWRNCRS